jgi:hypothetical protein
MATSSLKFVGGSKDSVIIGIFTSTNIKPTSLLVVVIECRQDAALILIVDSRQTPNMMNPL